MQKRPDRTVGLHYGVDIWQDVEISRDRVGLQDDEECSDAAFDMPSGDRFSRAQSVLDSSTSSC